MVLVVQLVKAVRQKRKPPPTKTKRMGGAGNKPHQRNDRPRVAPDDPVAPEASPPTERPKGDPREEKQVDESVNERERDMERATEREV